MSDPWSDVPVTRYVDPWGDIPATYNAPAPKPAEKRGFWQSARQSAADIFRTAKEANEEAKGEVGKLDVGINFLDAIAKPASQFGSVMVSGLTNAGNKLGLVSDETNEGIQEDMYRRLTGGTMTSDDARAREFEESKRTSAGKAGRVGGDLALLATGGGVVGGMGRGVTSLTGRLALRAGQGALLGAPSIPETVLTSDNPVKDLLKKEASDAAMGALFSNRLNNIFSGSTPAREAFSKLIKAGAVGSAQAGVGAAMGDESQGTFGERFGGALPGAVGTMLAMEAPNAALSSRRVSLDNKARAAYEAEQAALAPARELEGLRTRYEQLIAEREDLRAKDFLAESPEVPSKGNMGDSQWEAIVKTSKQRAQQKKSLQQALAANSDELGQVMEALRARGEEPWKNAQEPAPLHIEGDPEGARLAREAQIAEKDAVYRGQEGPSVVGPKNVFLGDEHGVTGELLPPDVKVPEKPGRFPELANENIIDADWREGGPDISGGPELKYLNAGLNIPQMLGEWWAGKGQQGVITTSDGKQIPYKINAEGKPEFFKDAHGNTADVSTHSARQLWEGLQPHEREEVFRLMTNPTAKPSNERIAKGLIAATQPGALAPEVASLPVVKRFTEGVRSLLAPQTASPEAGLAANIARHRMAERSFEQVRLHEALSPALEKFNKASLADFKRIMDYMEGDRTAKLEPGEEQFISKLQEELGKRRDQMVDLGILSPEQTVDDYFGRAWQMKGEEGSILHDPRMPIEGSKSFTKERVFDTGHEAMTEGFLPDTMNPIEMQLMKMRQMDKAIAGRKIINELVDRGLAKAPEVEGVKQEIPDGWKRVQGVPGGLYVEPTVAKVLENMMGKGLRGHALYDIPMVLNNAMNQVQLGLSGFHGGFVAADSMASRMSQSFQKFSHGLKTGDSQMLVDAAKDFGLSATVLGPAIHNVMEGAKIRRDIKAGNLTPETRLLLEGGMRFDVDPMHITGERGKFQAAVDRARLARDAGATGKMLEAVGEAALRAPLAGLEKAFSPIGEWFVPAVKAAAASDLARFELQRLGPDASVEARREASRKIVDSIDNRMGQLAYDNLFWNRVTKDLAHLATRSVGWNVGTARELGGGVMDAARGDFSHRASYTLALPIATAWMATLYQAMSQFLKGEEVEGPDAKTLQGFAKTGEVEPTGEDSRAQVPGYMGDVHKFRRDPIGTALHKTSPLINAATQLVQNKDFYGNKIYDTTATTEDQAKNLLKYGAAQLTPFSFRNIGKLQREGASPVQMGGAFVGVNPAPAWVLKTDAENALDKAIGAAGPIGGRDIAKAQRAETRKSFKEIIQRANRGDVDAQAQVREGLAANPKLAKQFEFVGQQGPEVRAMKAAETLKHLSLNDAWYIYKKGNEAERAAWKPIIYNKLVNYYDSGDHTDAMDNVAKEILSTGRW